MAKIQSVTKWQENLLFSSKWGESEVLMDGGAEPREAATPKQILLASMASCAGIDVVSILKKMRIDVKQCDVLCETETTVNYPSVFQSVMMSFHIAGEMRPDQVKKAVVLSMTKYCGVTAMIADAIPVYYKILLNDVLTFEGQADFTVESV